MHFCGSDGESLQILSSAAVSADDFGEWLRYQEGQLRELLEPSFFQL